MNRFASLSPSAGRRVLAAFVVGTAALLALVHLAPDDALPSSHAALVDALRAHADFYTTAGDLARAGEDVVLATRSVTVHALNRHASVRHPCESRDLVEERAAPVRRDPSFRWGDEPMGDGKGLLDEVTLTAHVSKGTYIRSLARDIAQALGTVGHVTYLRRTRAGPFGLSHAISLDILDEAAKARSLEHHLLPLGAALDDIPALALVPDQAGALRQGRVLDGIAADDGQAFAMLGDTPVALVEVLSGTVRVVRGFNL